MSLMLKLHKQQIKRPKDSLTLPAAVFPEQEEIVEANFVQLMRSYCYWTDTMPV